MSSHTESLFVCQQQFSNFSCTFLCWKKDPRVYGYSSYSQRYFRLYFLPGLYWWAEFVYTRQIVTPLIARNKIGKWIGNEEPLYTAGRAFIIYSLFIAPKIKPVLKTHKYMRGRAEWISFFHDIIKPASSLNNPKYTNEKLPRAFISPLIFRHFS